MDHFREFLRSPMIEYKNIVEYWRPSDTLEQYDKAIKEKDIPYGPQDIEYRNNNRGYRSDDFDSWQNHKYRIVYAGCSHTEGIGLPLDHVWSKVFHKMLCEKLNHDIPFWSIAVGGTGTDQIARNLFHEGELLRPQVVLAFIPFIERRERWHEDRWVINSRFNRDDRAARKVFTDGRYVAYQTEKNFSFISLMMEKWDSIFLYSSTDYFFSYYKIQLPRIAKVECGDSLLNYYDYARDGIHAGPLSHKAFAEQLFKNSWPTIEQKLNT